MLKILRPIFEDLIYDLNIGSRKKYESSIRWSSTKSSKTRKKTTTWHHLNNYVASKKLPLTKIMNKKKPFIFLVDFKVICAMYIIFVTLCMLIFEFYWYFFEIMFLLNFRQSKPSTFRIRNWNFQRVFISYCEVISTNNN